MLLGRISFAKFFKIPSMDFYSSGSEACGFSIRTYLDRDSAGNASRLNFYRISLCLFVNISRLDAEL